MEEAPTPETVNEPKGDIEHLKKFSATYKENVKYEISIYKRGTHFIIETEIPKDSQTIKYSNYYDVDSLKQTNKFFILCDSIDDIIDTIYENTTNYTCNINENHNNYEIKIPVPVKNIKEITFVLKERIKTPKEIINDLVSNSILLNKKIEDQNQKIEEQNQKIEEQNQKIGEQRKTIEEQNEKIEEERKTIVEQNQKLEEQNQKIEEQRKKEEEQNKKINQLEIKIMNMEEQNKKIKDELKEIIKNEIMKELKNEKEKDTYINISPILNSKSKIIYYELFKQLNNWINPSKSLKFELIFTASINGDSAKDFHKHCDGKGPTVTIVKGENGHIFGGYVTVPFSSDGKSHYDNKAFLFSLTNMKKFPLKIKEQAVCHY